jgi:hypothetical protein
MFKRMAVLRKHLAKHISVSGMVIALLALCATPAWANHLTGATATANCEGYRLSVNAVDLTEGATYTIDYSLTVTCSGGSPVTFKGATTFKATASSETVTTAGGTFTGLTGGCEVTGSATLTSTGSTVSTSLGDFTINGGTGPATLSCPTPACVIPPSGTEIGGSPASWNGFNAPAGSVVWINAHLDASDVPTNKITRVDFSGVTLVVNDTSYALPNGRVVFNPAVSTASTIVNADGSWTTTVNPTFSSDIFFDGQAIPVDSNLENGGHGNTGSTLSFSTSSSDGSLKFQWQWGAAVYTSWPGNAAANIEPVHGALQAGAPQNKAVEADLIQGPRGGGGSNFTGSWSGTGHGTCP